MNKKVWKILKDIGMLKFFILNARKMYIKANRIKCYL